MTQAFFLLGNSKNIRNAFVRNLINLRHLLVKLRHHHLLPQRVPPAAWFKICVVSTSVVGRSTAIAQPLQLHRDVRVFGKVGCVGNGRLGPLLLLHCQRYGLNIGRLSIQIVQRGHWHTHVGALKFLQLGIIIFDRHSRPICCKKHVKRKLETFNQPLKRRTAATRRVPAVNHNLVDGLGALCRRRKSVAALHLHHDIEVCPVGAVRQVSLGPDLVKGDAKAPNVRSCRVLFVLVRLGRGPADGHHSSFRLVIHLIGQVARKAKIADFAHVVFGNQNVPRGQVSVHKALFLQMGHASSHVNCTSQLDLELEVLLSQNVVQTALGHELKHDKHGLADRHLAHARDDVGMVELRHQMGLSLQGRAVNICGPRLECFDGTSCRGAVWMCQRTLHHHSKSSLAQLIAQRDGVAVELSHPLVTLSHNCFCLFLQFHRDSNLRHWQIFHSILRISVGVLFLLLQLLQTLVFDGDGGVGVRSLAAEAVAFEDVGVGTVHLCVCCAGIADIVTDGVGGVEG
eukprot:m.101185 g.101185  ORF g.101185 m.101185 type:complete len:513 (+) comp18710_c0_seq3:418-1956(+)